MAKESIRETDMPIDVLDIDIFLNDELTEADRNIIAGIFLLQFLNGADERLDKPCYPYCSENNTCKLDLRTIFKHFGLACTSHDIKTSLEKLRGLWYIGLNSNGFHLDGNGKKVYSPLSVKLTEAKKYIYWVGALIDYNGKIARLAELSERVKEKAERKAAGKAAMGETRKVDKVAVDNGSKADKLEKWIEENREQLIRKATRSELNVKGVLDGDNVSYVFQKPFVTAGKKIYFVDFFIPQLKVGIEVDGGYHTTKEQRRKDLEREMELEEEFGVRIYRLDNCDTSDRGLIRHCLEDILYRRKNELENMKKVDIRKYLDANEYNPKIMGELLEWSIEMGLFSSEGEIKRATDAINEKLHAANRISYNY